MPKLLLCTDLDRTLLPNGAPAESREARPHFARFVGRPEVTLAYVSGRSRDLVQEAIDTYSLPMPDWVIGDVGSTIHQVLADKWVGWSGWEQEIATDWRNLTAADLQACLSDCSPLILQEPEKQNRYKLSYYLPLDVNRDEVQQRLRERLDKEGVNASLIYSVDENAQIGLLDVLPANATKLHAVQFLMQHLDFDVGNTMFAGDSGNDLPVLCSSVPAVLVANADAETIELARRESVRMGREDKFYLARGEFLGMNGNYSAGILEGIAHFHPEAASLIKA